MPLLPCAVAPDGRRILHAQAASLCARPCTAFSHASSARWRCVCLPPRVRCRLLFRLRSFLPSPLCPLPLRPPCPCLFALASSPLPSSSSLRAAFRLGSRWPCPGRFCVVGVWLAWSRRPRLFCGAAVGVWLGPAPFSRQCRLWWWACAPVGRPLSPWPSGSLAWVGPLGLVLHSGRVALSPASPFRSRRVLPPSLCDLPRRRSFVSWLRD